MKAITALSAFVAIALAQAQSFSFEPIPTIDPATSIENLEPTATEIGTAPINTATACKAISSLVLEASSNYYPVLEAELAYACLTSVPINTTAASLTIDSIKIMVQMQSTLTYLKNPPTGYINEGVDILGGLDDIGRKVNNGDYSNEYDFEADIAALLAKAHDGHLAFNGYAYKGVFFWRRSRQITFISSSSDGKETPKIWAVRDYNVTDGGFTPSAVSKIDGKDAAQFLEEESLKSGYHDPDVRYNSMFYNMPADSAGQFGNPETYPGPSTQLTFENGTTRSYLNTALVLEPDKWMDNSVGDGQDFYQTFVDLRSITTSSLKKRRTPQNLPRNLQFPKEGDLGGDAIVPDGYPTPTFQHSASDVPLAGFFIESGAGTVGVLAVQTFNTEKLDAAEEFQQVVQEYIEAAKKQKVVKHIIDVRTNGGGLVMLGYDTYLQFFPTQEPQLQSRFRANDATDLLGSQISTLDNSGQERVLYSTPFNYHSYVDTDLKAFTSWDDMYGPTKFNQDSFSNLLRYNLSDPLVSSDDRFSIGITQTGYGNRTSFKDAGDPFKKEDIIILTDGICASTCALFTELMVQQSGVRTLAIGGRPSLGPMQAVGGTKGTLVSSLPQLDSISYVVVNNFATSQAEQDDWVGKLPLYDGVAFYGASVNFQDNIRKGLEKDGIPTQFLNDSASCRVFYEPEDYLNVTRLWIKAAEIAFGKDGGLDEERCVSGSVASEKAQRGLGEGSPTSPEGTDQTGNTSPEESKGAAAKRYAPANGGWAAVLVCLGVLVGSMAFGASLI